MFNLSFAFKKKVKESANLLDYSLDPVTLRGLWGYFLNRK